MDDNLAAAVDGMIAAGAVANRSEAVRVGLQRLVHRHRREQIGARIVAGYRAFPQADSEGDWADESTVGMVADEAW